MARFFRVVVLLLCGFGVTGNALATFACTKYTAGFNSWRGPAARDSKAEAAQDFLAYVISVNGSGACYYGGNRQNTLVSTDPAPVVNSTCGGENLVTGFYVETQGTCGCVAPLVEVNGVCVSPCKPIAGQLKDLNFGLGGVAGTPPPGMGSRSACIPGSPAPSGWGCGFVGSITTATFLSGTGANLSYGGLSGNQWAGWARMAATGSHCSPSDPTADGTTAPAVATNTQDTKAAPTSCPAGKFAGSVNGIEGCYGGDVNSSVGLTGSATSVTSTQPDGTTKTVATDTKVTDTCVGNVCTRTTVTTSTTTAGSTTTPSSSTSSGTSTVANFCAENPKSQACTNVPDGSFGGTCGAFSCSGDALQCATAKATNDLLCKFTPAPGTSALAVYESAKAAGSSTGVGSSTTAISAASFDRTELLSASAGGLEDMQIDVWGHPYLVKFSLVNSWLSVLGTIALACTALLCARIIGRG
jgi:hypothetical protein